MFLHELNASKKANQFDYFVSDKGSAIRGLGLQQNCQVPLKQLNARPTE
jgi:hypothetical protein